MSMSCCLPRLFKWKRPESHSPEADKDHIQSLENHVGLPPKVNVSSDTGFENPHTTAPTYAERAQLADRSNDTRESEVLNAREVDTTSFQQNLSPPGASIPGLPMTNEPDKAVCTTVKLSRDLWEEAFTTLDKDKQDLLCKIERPHGPKVVDRVAKETEKMYREHEERGWEANFKKGFESALKSVIKCKEIISTCVASDPTGHAAAAWTIVSLGLQLAQNEMDRRETILKASGILAENLVLLGAIEASYRDRTVRDSENLEHVIVIVYKAILELSAEIVHQNSLSSGKRVLNSFTTLLENRLKELKRALVEAQEKLSRWTSIIEQEYRKNEGKELDEKVDMILAIVLTDLVKKVSILESRALTAEEDRILDWYSKYPFFESHKDATSRRDANTGAWILESPEYKAWKESGDKVLWLYGNSGCGKSVLCSTIVEDLRILCDTDSSHLLAYWYFTFGVQESLEVDNLRCSMIKQLCSGAHTLPDTARKYWEQHRSEGPRINSDHLSETLDSLVFGLQKNGKEIFLVLDALDEYPLLKREELLSWIQHFSKSHHNGHVLITSRDEIDIRGCLGKSVTLDVAHCIIDDVGKFIQSCLSRITQGNDDWKNKYRSRMSERMIGVGERRFRWVALVEQRFSICIDSAMMEDALRDLPETLEGLYEDLLKRIPKDYKEKARLILMWLAYSLRPLTLQALASAVSIPNPHRVLEICNSSLVSIRRDDDHSPKSEDVHRNIMDKIVKLDHFTVREYLVSGRVLASDETAYFHVNPIVAHLSLAEFSVSRLIETNDVDLATMEKPKATLTEDSDVEVFPPDEDPLLLYSTIWYRHIQKADALSTSTPYSDEQGSQSLSAAASPKIGILRARSHRLFCKAFLQSFQNWSYLMRTVHSKPMVFDQITVASILGFSDGVRMTLYEGASVNEKTDHQLALELAVINGNLNILNVFLEKKFPLQQFELDFYVSGNRKNGAAVLSTILKAQPKLTIMASTLKQSARNKYSLETLRYILDRPDRVALNEAILEIMVKNPKVDESWTEEILSYGKDIGCTSVRMLEIFLRWSHFAGHIESLIHRCKPPNASSQKVVSWVFNNRKITQEALPVVLKYYIDAGAEIQFTPGMLIIAACFKSDAERLIKTILDQAKSIVITKDLLEEIVGFPSNANCLINLILNHENCGLKNCHWVTDRLSMHADKGFLSACPVQVSSETMQAALCWNPAAIEYLRTHARPNVTFAETFAGTESCDWKAQKEQSSDWNYFY